jgi:hypothetical protein
MAQAGGLDGQFHSGGQAQFPQANLDGHQTRGLRAQGSEPQPPIGSLVLRQGP